MSLTAAPDGQVWVKAGDRPPLAIADWESKVPPGSDGQLGSGPMSARDACEVPPGA